MGSDYVVRWIEDGRCVEVTPKTLADAVRAYRDLPAYDVAIFRAHADGREENLPSYEEALATLDAIRCEVERALDFKVGGSVVDGAPLLWTVPRSALTELLRIVKGRVS